MFCAARAPAPTRVLSPRQLPTDHDHAVPTREYQSDQSSRLLLIVIQKRKFIFREEAVSEGHLEKVYAGLFTAQSIC